MTIENRVKNLLTETEHVIRLIESEQDPCGDFPYFIKDHLRLLLEEVIDARESNDEKLL